MGSFSIQHWLILLAVVVVVFGTSKLKNIGKDVGSAVKDFKDTVKDETAKQEQTSNPVIKHQKVDEDSTLQTEANSNKTNS